VLNLEHRQTEALAACDAALAVVADFEAAHRLRIKLLLDIGRCREAAASCDALLAGGKSSAVLYELRGLARTELADYGRAIEDFTQAIALRPEWAPLLRKRAWLYLLSDAPRLALGDFDQAIGLEPSASDAYSGRGSARVRLGQHREAVADAEKALGLGEPVPRLFYTAARIYAQASIVATTEVRKKGQEAALLLASYQDRAAALVNEAIRRTPSEMRASFWRDTVQLDPALKAIRRRLNYEELIATIRK
jgi:tetratricopeptide (TPR) repeat protein